MWVNDVQVDLLKRAPRQLEVVMSSLSVALHLSHSTVPITSYFSAWLFWILASCVGKCKCWRRLASLSYWQCSFLNKINWTERALSWDIDICIHFGICKHKSCQLMAPKHLRAKPISHNENIYLSINIILRMCGHFFRPFRFYINSCGNACLNNALSGGFWTSFWKWM